MRVRKSYLCDVALIDRQILRTNIQEVFVDWLGEFKCNLGKEKFKLPEAIVSWIPPLELPLLVFISHSWKKNYS